MSTAPISFKYARDLIRRPKIKESKYELKQYSLKLELALGKTRQNLTELEKDNEILNKTYLKELKKGD